MAELSLECAACGKKFRVNFAVKPKQVPCPQCKAKVNTSAEAPAGGAAASATESKPAADAPASALSGQAPAAAAAAAPAAPSAEAPPAATAPAAPVTKLPLLGTGRGASAAKPPAANGAKPTAPAAKAAGSGKSPAAAPKPKRLPTLLKPEDVEFKGWTYDHEAEQARAGLQKADVLGVLWIGGVVLMLGFILFNMAKRMHWSPAARGSGVITMLLGGFGLLMAGYLFLKLKGKPDAASCARCRGVLGLLETLPSARDYKANNYTRGASGSAYKTENGKCWEIRRKWHVCKACKKYFLAEREARDFVGPAKADMEKREALYAEAAAAATAPKPAAPETLAAAAPASAAGPAPESLKPTPAPLVEGAVEPLKPTPAPLTEPAAEQLKPASAPLPEPAMNVNPPAVAAAPKPVSTATPPVPRPGPARLRPVSTGSVPPAVLR